MVIDVSTELAYQVVPYEDADILQSNRVIAPVAKHEPPALQHLHHWYIRFNQLSIGSPDALVRRALASCLIRSQWMLTMTLQQRLQHTTKGPLATPIEQLHCAWFPSRRLGLGSRRHTRGRCAHLSGRRCSLPAGGCTARGPLCPRAAPFPAQRRQCAFVNQRARCSRYE